MASALLLLALSVPGGAQSSSQSSALDEGVSLMRAGHFDQALEKLLQAHRLAPRNATIENLLGITETKLGHIDEADAHYRNAIRLQPSLAAPHRNLGFNRLNAKNYANAEPELREASRLEPNDPFAHFYLALLMVATGHDADALEQASHAGRLPDNDPETGASLAEAEIRLGRADAAAARIQRMETANQLPTASEYQIAILLARHALYHQAVHCFRRIASLDASWANRYNLALALLYEGQEAEASNLLSTLHAEQPANADVLAFLGSAFEAQEKMPEALEAYRAAAVADPNNPDRMLDYTRLLMDTDRYDEAIQFIQAGMSQTGTSLTAATPAFQLRLGAVEMIKGDYTAAREAFRAALASEPDLDAAYVGLAQTYARESNDTEAFRILASARAARPNHYLLEYYFGLLASRLGREQEAIAALENAAQLEPKSPDPAFELGKLYESKQDWIKARQWLERVVALNPQFAAAHYQLSRVYARLGMSSQAAKEAVQTHSLVDAQREDALHKQRERAGSFQPQAASTPSP